MLDLSACKVKVIELAVYNIFDLSTTVTCGPP